MLHDDEAAGVIREVGGLLERRARREAERVGRDDGVAGSDHVDRVRTSDDRDRERRFSALDEQHAAAAARDEQRFEAEHLGQPLARLGDGRVRQELNPRDLFELDLVGRRRREARELGEAKARVDDDRDLTVRERLAQRVDHDRARGAVVVVRDDHHVGPRRALADALGEPLRDLLDLDRIGLVVDANHLLPERVGEPGEDPSLRRRRPAAEADHAGRVDAAPPKLERRRAPRTVAADHARERDRGA